MAPPSTLSIHLSFFLVSFLSFNSAEGHPSPRPTCRVGCHEGEKIHIKSQECEFPPVKCIKGEILIQLEGTERWQLLKYMSYGEEMLVIQDVQLDAHSNTDFCASLHNFTPPNPSNEVDPEATTLKCGVHGDKFNNTVCDGSVFNISTGFPPCLINKCPSIEFHMMVKWPVSSDRRWWAEVAHLLDLGFALEWGHVPPADCLAGRNDSKHAFNSNAEPPSNCFTCSNYSKHAFNSNAEPPSNGSNHTDMRKIKIIIGASVGIGSFFLVCFLFFCSKASLQNPISFWRRKANDVENVEAFLQNYGSLIPRRYQYSELKSITNSFKDKLGQGGYGSVFKGKLSDGHLVAVKVLDQSKGNGEEFINEVASIGRTSHVNIVTLLGYCFQNSRRALVYEFMPKGSLERFIYSEKQKENHPLGWQKLSEIALGIARGLEYLHRGCNTRILHFDIKPHNILLDKDFCPKISDFGLAKLCPSKESTISLLDARGTIGYIAPEVYCRNFGGVSSKSDVYSYGMMLLEMVGGRRNIDAGAENTSEIYFPDWIYKRLHAPGDLGLHEITEKAEKEIARKMIMVGLWCIQTDPRDRPSMGKVVEMLEGSLESLQVPPKPFLYSPTRPNQESATTSS